MLFSLGTLEIGVEADIAQFKSAMDETVARTNKTARSITKSLRGIKNVGKDLTASLTLPAGGIFAGIVNEGRKFETTMVGIQKTTNLTAEETADLGKAIRKLAKDDLPIGVNELGNIAEAAGQLGVKGKADLLAFTDTVAKLGQASDLAGAEAAKTLARLLTVTGESSSQVGVLGSVIVRLGNNFAATESEIADMATRVAQATAAYKVSSAEASAMGAALKAVGVNAESGGTQVGNTMRAIEAAIIQGGEEMQRFADITGIASEDLKQSFGDNATGVFVKFIGGLKDVQDAGGSVTETLGNLGLKNDRILAVLPSLVTGYDGLTSALEQANDETKNTSALNDEAAAAFSTFESTVGRLKGSFVDLGIAFSESGLLDGVGSVVESITGFISKLGELSPATLKYTGILLGVAAAAGPLLLVFAQMGIALRGLIGLKGLAAKAASGFALSLSGVAARGGVATVAMAGLGRVMAVLTGLKGLAAKAASGFALSLSGVAARGGVATVAMAGFGRALALLTGPVGLAVLVGGALLTLASNTERSGKQAERLAATLNTLGIQGFDPATAKTKELADEMRALNLETAENTLNNFKQKLIENQGEIDTARQKIEELRKSISTAEDSEFGFINPGHIEAIKTYENNLKNAELIQRTLNVQIEQGEDKVNDMVSAMSKLESASKSNVLVLEDLVVFGKRNAGVLSDQSSAVASILEKEKDRNKVILELTAAISDGKDVNGLLAGELGKLTGETERLAESESKRLEGIDKQTAAAAELARVTGTDLIRTQEQLNLVLQNSKLFTENYAKALQQAKQTLLNDGLIEGTEEYRKGLESLGFQTEGTAKITEESTGVMTEAWENFSRGAFDSVKDFARSTLDSFSSIGEGFESLGDNLLNLAKDIVSDLIATFASNALKDVFANLFGGASGGGSGGGILDTILGAFGGGGGGTASGAASGGGLGGLTQIFGSGGSLANIGKIFSGGATQLSTAVSSLGPALAAAGPFLAAAAGIAIGRSIAEGTGQTGEFLGNFGIAGGIAAQVLSGLGIIGNARTPEEILRDEGQSITGDGFQEIGISQAGITIAAGTDGENGAGGFITGQNRNAFAEFAAQNGFDVFQDDQFVRVLQEGGTQEAFNELIESFRTINIEAGNFQLTSEGLFELIETGAIDASATLEENITRAFNISGQEANDVFKNIDSLYDGFVAGGVSSNDAVAQAFAQQFGVSEQAILDFINVSGSSADQFASIFSEASGDALTSLLDFNEGGILAVTNGFNSMTESALGNFSVIQGGLSGLTDTALAEARLVSDAYNSAIPSQLPALATSNGNNVPQAAPTQQPNQDSERLVASVQQLTIQVAAQQEEMRISRLRPSGS